MNIFAETSPFDRLLAYTSGLAKGSELLLVVLFSGVSIFASVAVGFGMELLKFNQPERPELLRFGVAGFFVMAVVVAPVLETLLLQQLPILIARRLGVPVLVQFLMGIIPFAATHFPSGIVTGVAAGVVGGAVFALAFLTFITQSKMKAFCMTAGVHSLHNLVLGLLAVRELN